MIEHKYLSHSYRLHTCTMLILSTNKKDITSHSFVKLYFEFIKFYCSTELCPTKINVI